MVSRMRPSVPRLRVNSEDMDVVGPPASSSPIAEPPSGSDISSHDSNLQSSPKKNSLAVVCQYDSIDLEDLEEVQVAICKLKYNPDAVSSV